MILHWIFQEGASSAKLSVFEKSVVSHRLPIEILPQVHLEITRKMMTASDRLVEILRDIARKLEWSGTKPSALPLDAQALLLVEGAADKVIAGSRSKFATNDRMFEASKKQVKIVEDTLVSRLHEELQSGKSPSMAHLFSTVEDELAKSYVAYSDRLAEMNSRLKATYVDSNSIPKVKPHVKSALSAIVTNSADVQMLCEGTGRMFSLNRCCALISLDYNDLVKKRPQIEQETLLLVCDPLYATAHLESRTTVSRTVEEEVKRRNQVSADFIESPRPAETTSTPAIA